MAAEEAAAARIDAALDAGQSVPAPTRLDALRHNPTYAGWIFSLTTVDPALLDDTTERVNVPLSRRVLSRHDALARAAESTRSGYISRLTLGSSGPRAPG